MPAQPDRTGGEFARFVASSRVGLLRYGYQLTRGKEDAEDLVQEALVRTLGRWESALSNPVAYTRKVMLNLVRDRARERAARPAMLPLNDHDGVIDEATASVDRALLVRDALSRLTPSQRAALVLRYHQDLSIEDTAAVMGCSVGTVKSQTFRALKAIRGVLGDDRDPGTRADTGDLR